MLTSARHDWFTHADAKTCSGILQNHQLLYDICTYLKIKKDTKNGLIYIQFYFIFFSLKRAAAITQTDITYRITQFMACLLKNTSWKESGTGWSPHPQRFPQAPIHPERIPSVEFKKSSREFVVAAFLCMQNKGGQFSADLLRKAVESELLCSPAGRLKLCQQCATLNRGSRAENQYITGATERRGGHRQKMYSRL